MNQGTDLTPKLEPTSTENHVELNPEPSSNPCRGYLETKPWLKKDEKQA
jgi:hypothetical protein